jgi:hypothetical protein
MRERRIEVEWLRQRIGELEDTAPRSTASKTFVNAASSPSQNAIVHFSQEQESGEAFDGGDNRTEYNGPVSSQCKTPMSFSF